MKTQNILSQCSSKYSRASGGLLVVVGMSATGISNFNLASARPKFDNVLFIPSVNEVDSIQQQELTGDGFLDFATNEKFGKIMMYRALGSGQFDIQTTVEAHGHPRSNLRIDDLDGNGSPDFVFSENTSIWVYYMRSSGKIWKVYQVETTEEPVDIELGDIDQDGDLDILSVEGNKLRIYRNNGLKEGFSPGNVLLQPDPATDAVTGDFDSDGDLDIAVLSVDYYEDYFYGTLKVFDSNLSVLLNDGTGKFQSVIQNLPYGNSKEDFFPRRVAVGDLDNDGDQDFVISAGHLYDQDLNEVLPLENLGNSKSFLIRSELTFTASGWGRHALPIEVADFNGEGVLDIIVSNGGVYSPDFRRLVYFENRGGFEFYTNSVALSSEKTGAIHSIQIDDFDQNGLLDILVGGDFGTTLFANKTNHIPFLRVDPLIKNQSVNMTVTAAQPGHTVFWMYKRGLSQESAGLAEFGGIILEVGSQFSVAGSAVADDTGTAVLNVPVPKHAPSDMITIQAVVQGDPDGTGSTKTNFHTTRIQP